MKKLFLLFTVLVFSTATAYANGYITLNQAQSFITANRHEEARSTLQNLINSSSENAVKAKAYFLLCSITKNTEEAISYCKSSSDLEQFNTDILLKLARLYNVQKNYSSAEQTISKALRLKPDMAAAYSIRGVLYQKMQRPQDALVDLNKAIELEPSAANHVRRGQVHFEQRNAEIARQDFETASRKNPSKRLQGMIAYYMAKLSYQQQKFDDAERFSKIATQYLEDTEKKLEAQSIMMQIQSAKEWR